jgi:acid stress chaperone HdeA
VLVVSCQQDPKATLWDKIRAKMPFGSKKVKPIKMTCDDFMALGESEKPEVAYWLAGYNAAKKTDVAASGEVDLETDTAVLLQECKPAPKASLWEKIKKKF